MFFELQGSDWLALSRMWMLVNERIVPSPTEGMHFALEEICRLADADGCYAVVVRQSPDSKDDPLLGWRAVAEISRWKLAWRREIATQWRQREQNYLADPVFAVLASAAEQVQSHLWRELAGPWAEHTPLGALNRALGQSDFIIAGLPVAGHVALLFMFDRENSRPAFGRRERELVAAALMGLVFACRQFARSYGYIDAERQLRPRERELLAHLLSGAAEKEIAARMGITAGSVHQYISRLYRVFGVASRAELMSRWLGNGGPPSPPQS